MQARFNTSHVTINRVRQVYKLVHVHRFNTSHVTINQLREIAISKQEAVSIHPMLLLIIMSLVLLFI